MPGDQLIELGPGSIKVIIGKKGLVNILGIYFV